MHETKALADLAVFWILEKVFWSPHTETKTCFFLNLAKPLFLKEIKKLDYTVFADNGRLKSKHF